jgi:pimeloyl-ACP methyl ester carboxylesterase
VNPQEPADLSIYDRLRRTDEELQAWLASGAHHRELAAQLGEAEYELLAPLARAAGAATIDATTQVFILPGIMGSQLGRVRAAPWPPNLLWIDPSDIVAGRLAELRLPGAASLVTLGAISYTYFALRLRLRAAGLAVQAHDYDWRQGISQQGQLLAAKLRAVSRQRVVLVAHSMGGLVARAALMQPGLDHVSHVITLGTPHGGTFAPVQALRGTYPSVRRLAALDTVHTAEQLAQEVFSSFPSLYEMLPVAGAHSEVDLHAPGTWPPTGPQPQSELLRAAPGLQQQLAASDARYTSIVGTGIRTVTGLARRGDDFEYTVSSAGDGTVPTWSATLAGADNRYLHSEHSALPRDAQVAAAIVSLLHGDRCLLASTPAYVSPQQVRVSDTELRTSDAAKLDWRTLGADERRRYFNQLNLMPQQYAATPGNGDLT